MRTIAILGATGSIGRQAQEASVKAREIGKEGGKDGGKKDAGKDSRPAPPVTSRRVTPPKNRPTPSGRPQRPLPPHKRGGGSQGR